MQRRELAFIFMLCNACGGSLVATHGSQPTQRQGILDADDVFEIRVYGESELSGTYRVGTNGTIDFPLLGRMHIAKTTAAQLSDQIAQGLKRYVKEPHVSIYVKEYNSQKIFVFGEVQKPGTFKYEKGMNIVQAITLAGGFAKLANRSGTYVTRTIEGQKEHIKVSLTDIGQGKSPNIALRPGDIVYVPEVLF